MSSPRSRSIGTLIGLLATVGAAALLYRLLRPRSRPPGPVTQAITPVTPADTDLGTPGRNTEQRLDEALHETFPASDPVSTHIE